MTLRCIHAVQASIMCAIVALVVSYPLLIVTKPVDDLIFGALTSCGASAVVALVIWYLAFPDSNASPRRGIWIGPLIVFSAMWVMFAVFGLHIDATYLGNEGLTAIVAKSVFMGLVFTLFGSLYTGIALFPLSMAIAVVFRKWQTGQYHQTTAD